ncbi:hypothetical protein GALL_170500 [mine drainage metagenome]|uniref:Membrane protein containing DUF1614 n=1 Tax=mine drainage metagenome TaxID=410659 RepID=A0A1J5SLG6_9ZZZZ
MPSVRLLILLSALIFLATFVQLGVISIAFEKLGLSQDSAYLLLLVTLAGSMINLPLFSVAAEAPETEAPRQRLSRLLGLPQAPFLGRTLIAVNVGGALAPMAFSAYLLLHHPLAPIEVAAAVAVVAAISYLTSAPIPGIGIGMPILVAPLAAALAAELLDAEQAAPLAYIAGALGVLIGADLLRLNEVKKLGAPVASIGGAGTFDGIFLSGLIAVLLA